MLSLSQVAYQGLTPKESQEFGQIICRTLSGCRSSVWSDYPHGKTKKNLCDQTLLSPQ